MREAACRNRSGAGLPFGTSVAENKNLKNLARPVVSRLARIRSGGEDDATHFGPRSQVSAWAEWGMARTSARSRSTVAAATALGKFPGRLLRAPPSPLPYLSSARP